MHNSVMEGGTLQMRNVRKPLLKVPALSITNIIILEILTNGTDWEVRFVHCNPIQLIAENPTDGEWASP